MKQLSRRTAFRILTGLTLLHAEVLIAFWLTNRLFYASTNDYLARMLGTPRDYITLVLVIAGLIGLWSLARLAADQLDLRYRLGDWPFALVSVIFVLFFYSSFGLLMREAPVQLARLVQMIGYFRLVFDTLLLFWAVLEARHWLSKTHRWQRRKALALLALGLLWALPLAFPPGTVYRGVIPAKPQLIAHRGASMLAPENTLAAAQRAADLGVYGLEIDLHISLDGQPFLMHDDTLKRTTNVAQVFPGREKDRAESFTLAEVRQLNAGRWFITQDPFQVVAGRSTSKGNNSGASELMDLEGQSVPTLGEVLDIVRSHGLIFIFDLKQPPAGHPFNQSFFDITLQQIRQGGIDPQVWFLVNREELQALKRYAPEMKPAAGIDDRNLPEASELVSAGYQIVNAEYSLSARQIAQYRQAGLWVNLYVVDEPWQFSRLWLLGVDSTTTNNAQGMAAMTRPVWAMPYPMFALVWSVVGVISAVVFLRKSSPR